jgi:hypothetical protein
MASDNLTWLEQWYVSQIDGDWEHQHGIKLTTIDNPGWRVVIDLADTALCAKPFKRTEVERSHSDWIHLWVSDQEFHIACGPANLSEAMGLFRDWAESRTS